jgi:hypothetical protein
MNIWVMEQVSYKQMWRSDTATTADKFRLIWEHSHMVLP